VTSELVPVKLGTTGKRERIVYGCLPSTVMVCGPL
jgi:hypothetical protein